MNSTKSIHFPAEWQLQSAVMLTWPHAQTDWAPVLADVIPCFTAIAQAIVPREKLIIVCRSIDEVKRDLGDIDFSQIIFREIPSNDTWARDHGPISVVAGGKPCLLDFAFNGWGLKFPANHDNQITKRLFESGVFSPNVLLKNMQFMVLEGGSIESDGDGTILTTAQCLLSANRNSCKSQSEIDEFLKFIFEAKQVLWLHNGYLAGDDTDSHIDTLARFCDPETIAYVQCADPNDEHYNALSAMESELKTFKTLSGKPYRLIPLPMATPVYDNGERLPATYANFLIINEAVLMPVYDSPLDEIAKSALQTVFPNREIIGINCLPLIKQHGSLHCVTMQLPDGFIEKTI
ncbi:MAG: agmatine deiminase family protein [Dysgonamonadaceae bacterium]|jgi:agmatine/peptidylarginine deiminase|nr:agmatine deiminase family protein [Dysgonamonadaceae bacterium]